jgi:hypothetical protein
MMKRKVLEQKATLCVILEQQQIEDLSQYAHENWISMSAVVRQAVDLFLRVNSPNSQQVLRKSK